MKITATLTEADVQEGNFFDCGNCPLARAIKRALPDYVELIHVGGGEICIGYLGLRSVFGPIHIAHADINDFISRVCSMIRPAKTPFEPLTLTLEIP